MIPRYTRDKIGALWSETRKFETWLKVELAVLEGWSKTGRVPAEAVARIRQTARVNPERIAELEAITHHDVIAFVEQIGETIGEDACWFHYGLTSSDILDTSLALILVDAGTIIRQDLVDLAEVLQEKAETYKDLLVMGRTHGVHAEMLTLGYRIAGWRQEIVRNVRRMDSAISEISVGKISGAVGTHSTVPPEVEEHACALLGLKPERFATQVIGRDRHAMFLSTLGVAAASAERIALQIRLLQQTELAELAEPFRRGQKGSSAMPHKRNPILCERICGLARVVKKNASAGLDNVALWYERDISHSSAERLLLPESTILLDYILALLTAVVRDLQVFPDAIERNLTLTRGLTCSQAVLNALLRKGVARKEAYEMVQESAFDAIRTAGEFRDAVRRNPRIRRYLTDAEADACFDPSPLRRTIADAFSKADE